MKPFNNTEKIACCKTIHIKDWLNRYSYKCNKPATHFNGSHYFCKRHSRTGRFVARNGEVGEILARFDTEQELRDNIHLYPDAKMQKITKSQRKSIF